MRLNISIDARNNLKNDELKRRLLECINSEQANFLQVAESFNNQERRSEEDYMQFCKATIAAIDQVLTAGNWEESLFLRNTVKPLRELRTQAQQMLQQILGGNVNPAQDDLTKIPEGKILLYVSIFQNDGFNLRKWELQLKSIGSYLLGRPVYEQEENIQKELRLRVAQTSEAYIVVLVNQSAIQKDPYQAPRLDRNGNALVTLAPGAITPDNIVEFVHHNKRYRWVGGKLIAK